MESFVLSKKDCRDIYLKIYFLIVQLFAVNFVLAYVMTYVSDIYIWFDDYTVKDDSLAFTPLAHIFSLMPIILIVVYAFSSQAEQVFKMTFINLIIIFLAMQTHMSMRQYGWEFILACFVFALVAIGILMFSATTLKIKYRLNYNKIKTIILLLWGLSIISVLISNILNFFINLIIFILGLYLAFAETQNLRSRLVKIRTQKQLDNLLYPFILTMIGNFLLINFYFETVKLFIKYFSIPRKDA